MAFDPWKSAAVVVLVMAGQSFGGLSVVTGSANADQWFGSAGSFTTISFTGFPYGTPVAEQYAPQGVHFVQPAGAWIYAAEAFAQDGWGMQGEIAIDMRFDSPMLGLAVYYPGIAKAKFYAGEQLLYSWSQNAGGGSNRFAGFFGDAAFDRVVFEHGQTPPPWGEIYPVHIDNLYFTTVPSPAGLAILIGAAALSRRLRRP